MDRTVAIVGHPLAAPENRLAFSGWETLRPVLVAPDHWPSRSLGTAYAAVSGESEGPRLHALPCLGAGRNTFFLWRGLAAVLEALRPSLVYAWEEPWCLATRQIRRWATRSGVPFVFYTAENRPKRLPAPFAALMRQTFAAARACVAPAPESAANVAALGFRGEVLPLPLWLAPRAAVPPDYAGRMLAYVGRLIPLKRVDLLIRALRLLPEFRLRVIGDGPESGRLRDLARREAVAERVDFRGHVPNADLEKALAGCGSLVLPTAANAAQAEQFGKAALEAVLCGLPALVSASGRLADWPRRFSALRALGDWTPEAVARAVRELWESPPSEADLLASRREVWEHFGAGPVGRRMERAFLRLLESG